MKISSIISSAYDLPRNFASLECGANVISDIQTIEWTKNVNCWLMEPIPTLAENIKEKVTTNIIKAALSVFDGKSLFSIFPNDSGWSCLSDVDLNIDQKSKDYSKIEIEVECITYKSLQDKLDLVFDVLVLDIEGHEEKILEYFKTIESKYLPKIVCIECGYHWESRKELMTQNGYNLDFYYYNNAYFSHHSSKIPTNKEVIDEYNKQNPMFIWGDALIYKNELLEK